MGAASEALKKLGDGYRSQITQIQGAIARLQRSSGKEYDAVRRQLDMCTAEKRLVEDAEALAEGDEAAIKEIEAALASRATPDHTRMVAALVLAAVDTPRALEVIYGRVVDASDPDSLRFMCGIHLGNASGAAARTLLLKAINHSATDDEFDGDKKIRDSMARAGMAMNLRIALISELMDQTGGPEALAARVKTPASFRVGWLFSLLALWDHTESEEYIRLASAVLRDKGNPEKMRIEAAGALYIMRKDSRGKLLFPKEAWDAVRSAWTERDWGDLHSAVGEVIKLQGAK